MEESKKRISRNLSGWCFADYFSGQTSRTTIRLPVTAITSRFASAAINGPSLITSRIWCSKRAFPEGRSIVIEIPESPTEMASANPVVEGKVSNRSRGSSVFTPGGPRTMESNPGNEGRNFANVTPNATTIPSDKITCPVCQVNSSRLVVKS